MQNIYLVHVLVALDEHYAVDAVIDRPVVARLAVDLVVVIVLVVGVDHLLVMAVGALVVEDPVLTVLLN